MAATEQGAWVGRRVKRHEDRRLLTGTGRFTDDVDVVGQLYCAIKRSPHPHARIVSVDATRARALPGVVMVISGQEAAEHWNQIPPVMDLLDMKLPRVYALATGKVYYEGEAVAAVAAETRHAAEDALALIDVEYEPLPAVAGIDDALGLAGEPVAVAAAEPGDAGDVPPVDEAGDAAGSLFGQSGSPSTLLYEEWGDNIQCDWVFEIGDPDAAFASADHVVRETIVAHRYSAVPLEARAVLSEYDPGRNELTVRLSTQFPHQCRTIFAAVFGIPEPNIRVLADDVGGGFGNKLQCDSEVIPVLLSILTRRPVKWAETRRGWLTSAPASRDFRHELEAAFSSDGTLLAVRDHLVGDNGCDGAVRSGGLGALLVGGTYGTGTYRVQSYWTRVQAVVTNKAPYGAYRGYGKDVSNLAIERVMDRAARELGIDPVEIRRRNLIEEYPYEICSGPIIESGSFREALDDVVEAMDLPALRERQRAAREEGRYLGAAVVVFLEPSSASIPMSMFNGYETASVRLTPDGQVMVLTGMQHIGQGMETAIAQVTADRLGVRPDDIRVVFGDTNAVPYGLGAFSSRGATYGVTAIYHAANQVREKLLKAAANMLEANVDDLELGDGDIAVAGTPSRRLTIADVAKAVYLFPGPYAILPGEENPTLEGNFVWTNPQVKWDPDEHGRIRLYPAHGGGALGALVEVDPETGEVRVERLWVCHDVGKMINPAIVESQIVGGMIQGFGGVMLEQLKYDGEGRMLAQTLNDYQLPNALSAPPIEVLHRESPSPITPLGTKGVGEAGCIGTPTVLMAAVEDALEPFGVRVTESPLTPDRILDMIDATAG